MRLAYLSTDFGVPIGGRKGASIHVGEMVRALREAGNEVTVFSPAIEAPVAAEAEGVRYVAVEADGRHVELLEDLRRLEDRAGLKSRVRQELRNLLYNLPFLEAARAFLGRHPVDVIYERYTLFGHAGISLARELGVPHLLEVNAPLAEEQEKTRGLELKDLARTSERRILCGSDAVIVVSRRLKEFAISCGVPEPRIHVLPNGVDPRRFAIPAAGVSIAEELKRRLNGRQVIGFVGSLKPWHGIETLIEAFGALHARCEAAHLLIVGDGPGREGLGQQAAEIGLGGAVTFTGAVPYEQIPHYLAAMDIAVAPYTPSENFYFSPIKIFEYMAAALPVVAGAIGQIEELIVDGETGLLFEPGRTDRLAEALERLVRDPELRHMIGENGSVWVRRERTWTSNAGKVVEIARGLTGEGITGDTGNAQGPFQWTQPRPHGPGGEVQRGIQPASPEGAR